MRPITSLKLGHAPVRAERLVQPAKPGRMLSLVDRFPGFAVILVGPHPRPECVIVRRDHSPLSARGHDLVLAERPSADVTDRTDGATPPACAVCLRAILDDLQPVFARQRHDRVHVGHRAADVDDDDGTGTRSQHRANGFGRQALSVPVHVGKHRARARGDHAGDRGDEGARRDDHVVVRSDAERHESEIQRQRAVGEGDGVSAVDERGELLLEGPGFTAGPE